MPHVTWLWDMTMSHVTWWCHTWQDHVTCKRGHQPSTIDHESIIFCNRTKRPARHFCKKCGNSPNPTRYEKRHELSINLESRAESCRDVFNQRVSVATKCLPHKSRLTRVSATTSSCFFLVWMQHALFVFLWIMQSNFGSSKTAIDSAYIWHSTWGWGFRLSKLNGAKVVNTCCSYNTSDS